jgi:putative sterol carrier protein
MSQVTDILKNHAQHIVELEGFDGSVRFDISNEGRWRFHVKNGDLEVEPWTGEADCVVVCDPDEFVQLATGKSNLITAAMQGRVQVTGDLVVAKKLHGILRSTERRS